MIRINKKKGNKSGTNENIWLLGKLFFFFFWGISIKDEKSRSLIAFAWLITYICFQSVR